MKIGRGAVHKQRDFSAIKKEVDIPAWRNSVAQLPVKERVAGSSPAVGANRDIR